MRSPGYRYSIESHQKSHRVTYQTARTDLLTLAQRGLLIQQKSGRKFIFLVPEDLNNRLEEMK